MENPVKQENRKYLMTLAAVDLLESEGPHAMTARKITAKMGMSSIVVYTEFGSMGNLVAAVVEYGYNLLQTQFEQMPQSPNVLKNVWNTIRITREFALAHHHLYAVMFATERAGGHQRTGAELELGVDKLKFLHGHCRHAVESGFFEGKPRHATLQLWSLTHGHIMLELAGYPFKAEPPLESLSRMVATSMIGLGANANDAKVATDSVHFA